MEREIPEGEAREGWRWGIIMEVWRAALPGAEKPNNKPNKTPELWCFGANYCTFKYKLQHIHN